ncbi:MAG: type III pantothenate kinase [Bacteriovoracaceae bacterium]|jgi:pantothenate kinase type III|nr:type III pantothenate kinase [Bacteriovoracaceae bacterium]
MDQSLTNIISIDIGNTNKKAYLFKNEQEPKAFNLDELNSFAKSEDLNTENTKTIISNVTLNNQKDLINPYDISKYLKDNSFFDLNLSYSKTIGIDRVLASFFVSKKQDKAIVIDTGSFTTVDIIENNNLKAGPILPGLELLTHTYKKSQVLGSYELEASNNKINDSQSSLNKGLYLSYIAPILKYIENYKQYPVFLTGGASELLKELLSKESDFCIQKEPLLIHKSLELIARNYL